jgi:hypothetical protein
MSACRLNKGEKGQYCTTAIVVLGGNLNRVVAAAARLIICGSRLFGHDKQECCDAACKHLNPSGNTQVTQERSLRNIHFLFVKKDMFPHPDPDVMCGKKPEPRLSPRNR